MIVSKTIKNVFGKTRSVPGPLCDILRNVSKSHLAGVRPAHLAKCAYIFSLTDRILVWIKPESMAALSRVRVPSRRSDIRPVLPGSPFFKCPLARERGETPSAACADGAVKHALSSNRLTASLCVSDCSLTEGAAFVLCAFHGAIRQHLEVEAVSAVKPRDDALQLGLCGANTGLNTR